MLGVQRVVEEEKVHPMLRQWTVGGDADDGGGGGDGGACEVFAPSFCGFLTD